MSSTDGFSDFFYTAPDGLKLHARVYGETNSADWQVVCLPGLTRNARDFHELALYLSQRADHPRKVIAFDYRGRGLSAYDPDISHYNVGLEPPEVHPRAPSGVKDHRRDEKPPGGGRRKHHQDAAWRPPG
ncbi:alpha/beta hydrolase, partial [Mesorhizobium sp. M1121]|uniref:alpha/beta hydrolase n=1 Tax=Mesorhizobium sp. M1121 TaxID=2957058 RepID=UPI00333820B6